MHNQGSPTDLQTFVYSVAHDFRRPIRQIRTIAELLQENLTASIDDETAEMLDWMVTASDNALLMMERLLIFSRLLSNPQQRIDVALAPVCRAVIEAQQPRLGGAAVELAIAEDLQISADPDVVRLLVAELLDNAISYGGADSPVVICATCADGLFILSVRDGGDGIAAARMAAALRPFGRLEAEDERHVGLGLNCCVRISELWGGELTFNRLHPGFEVALKIPQQGFVTGAG